MKQEEGKKNKKGKMVKRQVSIITVFLIVVLMVTITVIAVNNTNKTNALEQIDGKHITNIKKNLIKYEKELPDEIKENLRISGDLIYYVGKYCIVADVGSTIKLVYKVTVTGDEGANYTVTDTGADRIGGDLESGYIPESGVVEIYYKGEFEITENTYKLKNTASVIPGKYYPNTGHSESKTSSTETSPPVLIQKKINIKGIKIWDDNNNEANKRPTSIKLQVKRNGIVVEESEVNESTSWKHTFELPKYDERGDEIEYTIDEDYVSELYIKNIVGYVITNKFVVPEDRVKITGTKVWEDNGNASGKRDDTVILQLKNERDEVIREAEVSDKNNWSYEFEVSKYDILGNEIKYHIDERDTKNKFYQKELTDINTITNKFVVPDEKVLIKAVKVWDDKNNSADKRPSSVTLQIYNKDAIVVEKKVTSNDNWNFEVELPKYDELGDEITYTVDEKETSKYYEKSVSGNIVTNRLMYELPNTSDINVFMYVVIFFIAVIGIIVGVIFIRKNKRK